MNAPLEWSFVVTRCWTADAFLVFVTVAWDALYAARRDGFFFMREVFSYLKERGKVRVTYGVEFGPAYSLATP